MSHWINGKNKQRIQFTLSAVGLFAFVVAVFIRVRNFAFLNFDDNIYVTANLHVNSGLSVKNWVWAFTQSYAGHWHPLSWFSHQLDCQLFGLEPGAHHLINLFFHALNAVLLFLLLFQLFGSLRYAILFAALFALHPQRIESVVWITERKDVLSLCFGLLTLLAYVGYRSKGGIKRYVAMSLFLVLGLLAKPSLVVMPCLLLLLDFWPLSTPSNFRRRILEKAPLFLLCFISSAIVLCAQHQAGALPSLNSYPFADRFSSALVGYWTYWQKTFWPADIAIFYPFVKHSLTVGLAAFVAFVGVTFLIFRSMRKYPALFFGWAWFTLSLLPVIGLIQVGGQAMADRWSYLPHVGLAIAFCGTFAQSEKRSQKKIIGFLLLLLSFSIVKTSLELPHWKNSETLFSHTLEVTQNNFVAHTNLGQALASRGEMNGAASHYEEAIRLHPFYSEALNNLGGIKAQRGDLQDALTLFEKALVKNPTDVITKYNIALAHYSQGEKIKAFQEWLSIHAADPNYEPAKSSLRFMIKNDFEMICKVEMEDKIGVQALLEKIKWNKQETSFKLSIEQLIECMKQIDLK